MDQIKRCCRALQSGDNFDLNFSLGSFWTGSPSILSRNTFLFLPLFHIICSSLLQQKIYQLMSLWIESLAYSLRPYNKYRFLFSRQVDIICSSVLNYLLLAHT